jgi:hypothetical protein
MLKKDFRQSRDDVWDPSKSRKPNGAGQYKDGFEKVGLLHSLHSRGVPALVTLHRPPYWLSPIVACAWLSRAGVRLVTWLDIPAAINRCLCP